MQDDKWLAYYGPPLLVVTTGDMTSRSPARVAFYSRELYQDTVARVEDAKEAVLAQLAKLDAQPTNPATGRGSVLNDKAISLPPPQYPPIARSARASGTVSVQVTIDKEGNVVAAQAVSGHSCTRRRWRQHARRNFRRPKFPASLSSSQACSPIASSLKARVQGARSACSSSQLRSQSQCSSTWLFLNDSLQTVSKFLRVLRATPPRSKRHPIPTRPVRLKSSELGVQGSPLLLPIPKDRQV